MLQYLPIVKWSAFFSCPASTCWYYKIRCSWSEWPNWHEEQNSHHWGPGGLKSGPEVQFELNYSRTWEVFISVQCLFAYHSWMTDWSPIVIRLGRNADIDYRVKKCKRKKNKLRRQTNIGSFGLLRRLRILLHFSFGSEHAKQHERKTWFLCCACAIFDIISLARLFESVQARIQDFEMGGEFL